MLVMTSSLLTEVFTEVYAKVVTEVFTEVVTEVSHACRHSHVTDDKFLHFTRDSFFLNSYTQRGEKNIQNDFLQQHRKLAVKG